MWFIICIHIQKTLLYIFVPAVHCGNSGKGWRIGGIFLSVCSRDDKSVLQMYGNEKGTDIIYYVSSDKIACGYIVLHYLPHHKKNI